MDKLQKLQEQRAAAMAQMRALLEQKDGDEPRELTAEDETRFSELEAEVKGIDGSISRLSVLAALEARATEAVRPANEVAEIRAETAAVEVTGGEHRSKFESTGDFLMAVKRRAHGEMHEVFAIRERRGTTGMGESKPHEGGFLVGKDDAPEIFSRMATEATIMDLVPWTEISGNANGLKVPYVAGDTRAAGTRHGGIRGYWVAEGDDMTASTMALGMMELDLKKLAVLFYATDELLEDSQALMGEVLSKVPQELVYKVEDAFVNGSGAGQPLGVFTGSSKIEVAKETGQAADTINAKNVVKMYARMPARCLKNAVWLVNQNTLPQLLQMNLSVGTGGNLVFMPPGGLSQTPYGTLFGRPVIPSEYCQKLGDAGDILFVDWSQYKAIRKGGLKAASSIHVKFVSAQTAFRFLYRCDGQSLWNAAITPENATSDTLSPVVALAERA